MLSPVIVLLVASSVSLTHAIDKDHMAGMRKLLKKYPTVFPTCSLVFFSNLVDYDTAEQKCKQLDAVTGKGRKFRLVTVKRIQKNHDLTDMLELAYPYSEQPEDKFAPTKWVWTGLRKVKNNEGEDAGQYHNDDWRWADGSRPNNFYLWLISSPEQAMLQRGEDGCDEDKCYQNQMVINHEGLWDDTFKFKKHPYACDYNGKYILSDEHKTWQEAKMACEEAGLYLAKVRSAKEVEEIKRAASLYLTKADPSWGTWDQNNWIWTGGNDLENENDWRWLDGTPVEDWDLPWKEKAGKDNAGSGQNALALSRWGEFDDSFDNDTTRSRPFACQCPGS